MDQSRNGTTIFLGEKICARLAEIKALAEVHADDPREAGRDPKLRRRADVAPVRPKGRPSPPTGMQSETTQIELYFAL